MLLFALVALQATPPQTNPSSPNLFAPYRACVLSKAAEWGKAKEEAKVIVETALGACSGQRDIIRAAAAKMVKDEGGRSYTEVQALADAIVAKLDANVSNLAYQEVIKARLPR